MARTKKNVVATMATVENNEKASRFGLDVAIRKVANGDISLLNEGANTEEAIRICKGLVSLADSFNERDASGHFIKGGVGFTHNKSGVAKPFPMSFLVYFAVGKDAHKEGTLRKGYTRFDEKKAKEILRMLKYWGTYNENPNLSRNDKVVHAITKYYERVSPKIADFKRDVEAYWKPWGQTPKTMKEITLGLHIDVE